MLNLNDNDFHLTMNGINYNEEIESPDIFLTDTQLAFMKKINNVIAKGFDYDDNNDTNDEDNDENIAMIDCKYYTIDTFNNQKFKERTFFSILHLNIHSVAFHIDELRLTLKLIKTPFDFICLTESKIQVDQVVKVNIDIDGYQSPVGTPTESSKGGVLIYVKNDINFFPRPDLDIYKSRELESYFIEVLNPKGKNTIIGTMYRHPCMDQNLFLDDFVKPLCDKLTAENKKIYLAGDFNLDLSNLTHAESQRFFEIMMSYFLRLAITLPTKINKVRHTVIDNILTDQVTEGMISGNLSIAISDHLPSFLLVPNENECRSPKQKIFRRDTKNFERENFILDFLGVNWDDVLQLGKKDVNISLSSFLDRFNGLLDKYMPLKKVNPKKLKSRNKPWVTNEILHKIKYKNKVFKNYSECKTTQINLKNTLYAEYKELKNEITSLIRISKKNYYTNYFTNNKKNLRKTWYGIKEIINPKSKHSRIPSFIEHNDSILSDDKSICESFNKYFTSIADNILNDRKYTGVKSHKDYLHNPVPNSFFIRECNPTEVEKLIASLNRSKATGPYSIPTNIIHLLKSDISIPLSKIYNLSLESGIYPETLKVAKTVPIFKKGSHHLISNYRPISLLSNLNKILEKLMFDRTYDFLDRFNSIYDLQFGFRKKYSVNHALIKITESIRAALDGKKVACGIFKKLLTLLTTPF